MYKKLNCCGCDVVLQVEMFKESVAAMFTWMKLRTPTPTVPYLEASFMLLAN